MATYQVTLDLPGGQTGTFQCADDEFVLDAAEEAGFELPSSCRSGACTSCQGRVLSGKVSMEDQSTLEDEHIAAGYVCTCIAYPESDLRIVTHQMDNFENGVMSFDDAAPVAVPVAAPVVVPEQPVVVPEQPVVAAPAMVNGVAADGATRDLAKKTLDVLRDIVAGDPALEAKCDEMGALLGDASTAEPEYIPFRSDDTGYTIWLNKNDPRNSYYEYH